MPDLQFNTPQGFFPIGQAMDMQSQAANVLAQQRAQAILEQIKASRENEVIDSTIAHQRANEAYLRQQGEAMLMNAQREKAFDKARAESEKRSQMFAPLNALWEQAQTNIPGAANSYNTLKAKGLIPSDLSAMELPSPTSFSNPGQPSIMSRFNPEIMKGYLEGLGRPKEVSQQQIADTRANTAETNNLRDNQTKIQVEAMRSKAIQSKIEAAAQLAKSKQIPTDQLRAHYQQLAEEAYRSGDMDTAKQYFEAAERAAKLMAISGPSTAGTETDMSKLGLPDKSKVESGANAPRDIKKPDPLGIR